MRRRCFTRCPCLLRLSTRLLPPSGILGIDGGVVLDSGDLDVLNGVASAGWGLYGEMIGVTRELKKLPKHPRPVHLAAFVAAADDAAAAATAASLWVDRIKLLVNLLRLSSKC